MPKWLIWLIAPTIGMTRQEVSNNIGYPWKANNSKAIKELGLNFRSLKNTATEFFSQLEESNSFSKK